MPHSDDLETTNRVAQRSQAHEVDPATEQQLKFITRRDPLADAPEHIGFEIDQNISVLRRRRVVSKDGAKERQLPNPPLAAEITVLRSLELIDVSAHA